MVVVDRLVALAGSAVGPMLDLLRAETGNPTVDTDPRVARDAFTSRTGWSVF